MSTSRSQRRILQALLVAAIAFSVHTSTPGFAVACSPVEGALVEEILRYPLDPAGPAGEAISGIVEWTTVSRGVMGAVTVPTAVWGESTRPLSASFSGRGDDCVGPPRRGSVRYIADGQPIEGGSDRVRGQLVAAFGQPVDVSPNAAERLSYHVAVWWPLEILPVLVAAGYWIWRQANSAEV